MKNLQPMYIIGKQYMTILIAIKQINITNLVYSFVL